MVNDHVQARRPLTIIIWTEGQRKNPREEGDENSEQFSNTEFQREDVVSRY
jgi:hypothetical protein